MRRALKEFPRGYIHVCVQIIDFRHDIVYLHCCRLYKPIERESDYVSEIYQFIKTKCTPLKWLTDVLMINSEWGTYASHTYCYSLIKIIICIAYIVKEH